MKQRLPLLLLAAAFALLLLVEWFAPRPLDWRPSFEDDATQPYGGRVIYDLLPDLLGGAEVERVERPPYLQLGDSTDTATTYFFLTDAFAPDDGEARRLYRYAERGNTVFIAATSFDGPLADTLGVETGLLLRANQDRFINEDSLTLTNPHLKPARRILV